MIDSTVIGKYRNHDVFLIREGKEFFIAFGNESNQTYWLEALNRILRDIPNYKFYAGDIEVDMNELKPIIKDINNLVSLI